MPHGDTMKEPHQAKGPTGAIRRAHLSMQRCADTIFTPRRTTTDQYALLWAVGRSDGIRQNELANRLFSDPNTVTAMLARLEKRGVVMREVCEEDGRARVVRLTPAGRRLLERLSADWDPIRRRLREIFAGEAGQEALRILNEVCQAMMQIRDEALAKPAVRQKRAARAKSGARPETVQV